MVKMIGCIFIMLAGYLGGYHFACDCKLQLEQYYELKRILSLLEGEIRYRRTTLPEAFLAISKKTRPPFSELLNSVAEEASKNRELGISQIWRQKSEDFIKNSSLGKADLEIVNSIGDSLGYFDIKTQIDNLALCREQMDEKIRGLQGEIAQKGRVYQCLGITSGILLVIIFL